MSELIEHTWQYWSAGGPLLIPLALICFGIWGYFLCSRDRMVDVLRQGEAVERELADGQLHKAQGGFSSWFRHQLLQIFQ